MAFKNVGGQRNCSLDSKADQYVKLLIVSLESLMVFFCGWSPEQSFAAKHSHQAEDIEGSNLPCCPKSLDLIINARRYSAEDGHSKLLTSQRAVHLKGGLIWLIGRSDWG
jgi:hypothetical protein